MSNAEQIEKFNKHIVGATLEYTLKDRLAIRIAANLSGALNVAVYSEEERQLLFDAISDGLMKRTEDELLSLIKG